MESASRTFDGLLRQLVTLRDRTCRTPDHAVGPTTAANGQGLCNGCNQLKGEPGHGGFSSPEPPVRRHGSWGACVASPGRVYTERGSSAVQKAAGADPGRNLSS